MKKLFSFFITFTLLFTFVPFNVSASEVEQSDDLTLTDKALIVFPEFAEKMSTPNNRTSTYSRRNANSTLVAKETRPISDTEFITYAEYSDGLILLSGYSFPYESSLDNAYYGSTFKSLTIDIEAECILYGSSIGSFTLDNVNYVINNGDNNFDSITDPGTGSKSGQCISGTRVDYRENETATQYARLSYELQFKLSNTPGDLVRSYLTLNVGEDTAVIDHSDWN